MKRAHENATLLRLLRARYSRATGRRQKTILLDTLTSATGYSRKYALSLLHTTSKSVSRKSSKPATRYDMPVQRSLISMWHAAGCPSGRKLAQEIHNLASCTRAQLAEAVAEKLRGMSVSTIDRILRQEKAKLTKSTIQSSQQSSAEDNERLASDRHAHEQKRRSGTGKPGRKTIIDELWHEIEELRRNQPKLSAGKILKILMTRNPGKLRETQLSTIKTRLVHRHAAKTTPRIGSAKFYLEPDWQEIHWSLKRKVSSRKTLWEVYKRSCLRQNADFFSYSQFCRLYTKWRDQLGERIDVLIEQNRE